MKRAFYRFSKNHTVITQQLDGFTLSESMYPSKLRQPRHKHEFASFSFVLSGNYIENYEKRGENRLPLTLVFHPPQEWHSVQFQDKSVKILNVQFDAKSFERIRERSRVLDSSGVYRHETLNWLCSRLHREFRCMDALSPMAIEALILEILVEAARSGKVSKDSPRWLECTKEFLHAHFAENLTLEEIAGISRVHPVHLSRVFREKFGCTIGEYVRNLRLESAIRQISSSDCPLSEIASAAGFSDQSHLTRTFKSRYGFTPSEYRRISRHS